MTFRNSLDTKDWAIENFVDCDLGDKRRSNRLVKIAEQVANRPAASLPKIARKWADIKGMYRLFDSPAATLASVTQTHRQKTVATPGRFLVISDTTHVSFGAMRNIPDAGLVSVKNSTGFLLHSGLLFDVESQNLIGLAGQVSHVCKKRQGKQNSAKQLKRWRESEMWLELFEQVGPAPTGSQHIHVCDAGADNFEVFCTLKEMQSDFVIRAGKHHRNIITPDGQTMPLSEYTEQLTELGQYDLRIARGNRRKARTARLKVSAGAVTFPLPRFKSPRSKEWGCSIELNVVVVEEVSPPQGVEPIRWVLLTTLPVDTFEQVWEIIEHYESRWLIEEWHKALKTGCRLEDRKLQTVKRLLPLTGVLSVVAVMLMQLKSCVRDTPETPAKEVVPPLWIKMLQAANNLHDNNPTVYEFWRGVAMLGGFLGRKGDGQPGWQTIWSGWQDLHQLVNGVELLKNPNQKCG